MHTQIRMRMVIRILTLVQSGKTPLQVSEEKEYAVIATLILNPNATDATELERNGRNLKRKGRNLNK